MFSSEIQLRLRWLPKDLPKFTKRPKSIVGKMFLNFRNLTKALHLFLLKFFLEFLYIILEIDEGIQNH